MPDNIQLKIEDKIIDYINLDAGGRLIIFRPKEATRGIDLIVKKKGEYESRHGETLSQNPIVKAQVFGVKRQKAKEEIFLYIRNKDQKLDASKLGSGKNFYMILVSFDALKQDIDEDVRIIKLDDKDDKKEFLINKKDISQFFLDIIL